MLRVLFALELLVALSVAVDGAQKTFLSDEALIASPSYDTSDSLAFQRFMGPVQLGIGAMLAFSILPGYVAAVCAVGTAATLNWADWALDIPVVVVPLTLTAVARLRLGLGKRKRLPRVARWLLIAACPVLMLGLSSPPSPIGLWDPLVLLGASMAITAMVLAVGPPILPGDAR